MNKEFVYFISDGEYVKIGKSTKPKTRLSNLQVGNPRKLSILYLWEVDDFVSEELWQDPETYLHDLFKDFKVSGEWFRLEGVLQFLLKAYCFSMVEEDFREIYKHGPNDAREFHKKYNSGQDLPSVPGGVE